MNSKEYQDVLGHRLVPNFSYFPVVLIIN
uniref:Uncharacterized protein n=1 Tax=Heterorhabditis bacteriophora TaxID=37862 RepID=A0A1I7X0K7_HETBA